MSQDGGIYVSYSIYYRVATYVWRQAPISYATIIPTFIFDYFLQFIKDKSASDIKNKEVSLMIYITYNIWIARNSE